MRITFLISGARIQQGNLALMNGMCGKYWLLKYPARICGYGCWCLNTCAWAVHELLDMHTVQTYEHLQITLMQLRRLQHHYDGRHVLAIDPHRIQSATRRTMPHKKKRPDEPGHKMMQTFFCVDAFSGQPLAFTLGSSGKNCSPATLQLADIIEQGGPFYSR
ncbi:hypothetical protein [Foetidibacter luteolus]|uniref:hypothetical protein n=2 Tax=Foetidibacter luteolus TaxID=2608880 RepID=UPI00129B1252|nr:hypothetical protein [Foetidibacter luteolus]